MSNATKSLPHLHICSFFATCDHVSMMFNLFALKDNGRAAINSLVLAFNCRSYFLYHRYIYLFIYTHIYIHSNYDNSKQCYKNLHANDILMMCKLKNDQGRCVSMKCIWIIIICMVLRKRNFPTQFLIVVIWKIIRCIFTLFL